MKRLPWFALFPLILCSCETSSVKVTPVDNPLPPVTGEIVDISRVSQVPIAIYQAAPRYPHDLRLANIQGQAIIVFVVAPDGSVMNASVQKATDFRFGEAALAAVKQWRFHPGMVDGRPVYTRMTVPVGFSLVD